MKILIVGVSGFIGKSLVDYLYDFGCEVYGFDLVEADYPTNLKLKKFYIGSVESISSVLQIEDNFDAIVYLSATVSSIANFKNDQKLLFHELNNAASIVDFSRKSGLKKFIYISSGGTIYGSRHQPPFLESMPPSPKSIYALSKNILENYFSAAFGELSIKAIILRLSNPFGLHQKINGSQGVIPIFISKIVKRESIEVRNLSAVRDYIYIEDVCRAIVQSITYDGNESIFNIGSGFGVSTQDLIYKIEKLVNIKAFITEVNSLQSDLNQSYLNVDLAKKELLWEPQINFEEGLFRVHQHLAKTKWK